VTASEPGPATDAGPAPQSSDGALGEALAIVGEAEAEGLVVRLMGGLAFRAAAPGWPRNGRPDCDIDLATRARDRKALTAILERRGFVPDRQQNALFGHKQLYFFDPTRRLPLDVLVDRFEMCHACDLGDRLTMTTPTLPLAELLLSKLQVVRINRKDVLDALVLLADHPLAEDDGASTAASPEAAINVARIVALTSTDWGWWRTVTGNLDKLDIFLDAELQPGELDTGHPHPFEPHVQIAALRAAIHTAPKTAKWKLRARVGERVAWYALPEEMAHGTT
jgi:hypothetical protein